MCDAGDPKTSLDQSAAKLHDDWEKLGALFGDVLAKLTEALVQTQEFKSIAGKTSPYCMIFILKFDSHTGGLEQWMSGMGETLTQQDLIAARVNLIEGQIEGFKVYNTCMHVYIYI